MAKYLDRIRVPMRDLERRCGSGGGSPNPGLDHATGAEREREREGGYHRDCRTLIWLGVLTVSLTMAFAAWAAPVDRGLTGNGIDSRGNVGASTGSKDASQARDNYISKQIPTKQVVGKDGKVGPKASHRGSGQWGGGGFNGTARGGQNEGTGGPRN